MDFLTRAHLSPEVTELELRNQQIAYEAACEGIVLLKNDDALPLSAKRVALYGGGAKRTIKGGTGSGEVNERHSVSILEGMESRGFEILSKQWIDDYEIFYEKAHAAYREEKKKRLNFLKVSSIMDMLWDNYRLPAGPEITGVLDTDTCVYVLSRQAGEGGDRKTEPGDYCLTGEEKAAIAYCAAHYAKFVLVINCGCAMDMGFLEEIQGINAILYICQPGTQGGNAVADILSGAVTPSGKLTDTWAKTYDDVPFGQEYSYQNGDPREEYYREGIYVGYRYFDSFGVAPAFPFGFGLSYTDFELECVQTEVRGREVTVTVKVTNTGSTYSGKEVAQLYVSAPEGRLCKEYQSLAAFAKTALLAPGQSQTLELRFDLGELSSYREADNCFVLEQGSYVLRLGNSSRNTAACAVVELGAEVIVSRHEAVCPMKDEFEELSAPERKPEDLTAIPRYTMDPAAFVTETYTYKTPDVCRDARVRQWLKKLTVREMVDIVVGVGQLPVKHGFTLPGAVGVTTSRFWDRGLANVTLCDGPAGLRIQSRSTVDAQGHVKPVEMAMSVYEYIPGPVKGLLTGDLEKEVGLYQYTTAFPVENCLAQSWNPALLERVGDAVYREMKEFGCTYWLAPAMNIHRNPLCGRNFEYFSEDPRLTGIMAAAITRGVQQEQGYYVTIKHFACNNQEDARTKMSSNVSQRALREIYLRGFQMAVKAGAGSVMTSYNKINGVYTPNSYDLCTKVLRNEWGFDGVVMTDWYSTNPGQGDNALCMAAGNDLIMPGTWINKQQILLGLQSGKLTRRALCRCCGNVIRQILDSAIQREFLGNL